MNNLKKIALASVLALSSVAANAEVITFGNLSTDAQYNVIADTERGREYLRFDTFDMTYDETVAATSAGGIYEDWTMADSVVNYEFISAVFSQNGQKLCSEVMIDLNDYECGTLTDWNYQQFGASYGVNWDYFAFISIYNTEVKPFGITGITSYGRVQRFEDWTDEAGVDSNNIASGHPVNFLLYRDNDLHIGGFNVDAAENNLVSNSTSVPLPATLGLLGLAMAGLSFRRKSA